MRIERVWAIPNKWTFKIIPIKNLLMEEGAMGLTRKGLWCDPFAGRFSPADIRNDINPDNPAEYHMDALEFMKGQPSGHFDGVLFDPPYSFTQAAKQYKGFGKERLKVGLRNQPINKGYWTDLKKEVIRVVKRGGKIIQCGWNTNAFLKEDGGELTRILIVPHGSGRNDTLVTVEIKGTYPLQA